MVALPTVRGLTRALSNVVVAYVTYESEDVEMFQETVNAVLLTFDVTTLEMTGIRGADSVVNESCMPVSVVEVATLLVPAMSVA